MSINRKGGEAVWCKSGVSGDVVVAVVWSNDVNCASNGGDGGAKDGKNGERKGRKREKGKRNSMQSVAWWQ